MGVAPLGLGVCFPLSAVLDYRGFRVSAIAQLPIGKDTLVYGSADGTHKSP